MNKSLTALVGPTLSADQLSTGRTLFASHPGAVVTWSSTSSRYDARNENVEIQLPLLPDRSPSITRIQCSRKRYRLRSFA